MRETPAEATKLSELTTHQKKSGFAAWLGWFFDGLDLHLYTLVATVFVAELLLVPESDASVPLYGSWIQAAFLLGWALGGAFFGIIGDHLVTATEGEEAKSTGRAMIQAGRNGGSIFGTAVGEADLSSSTIEGAATSGNGAMLVGIRNVDLQGGLVGGANRIAGAAEGRYNATSAAVTFSGATTGMRVWNRTTSSVPRASSRSSMTPSRRADRTRGSPPVNITSRTAGVAAR